VRVSNREKANKFIGLALYEVPHEVRDAYQRFILQGNSLQNLISSDQRTEFTQLFEVIRDPGFTKNAEALLTLLSKKSISLVVLGEENYPAKLAAIYRPPPVIYYWGDLTRLNCSAGTLAIVGTRSGDPFGCQTARDMAGFVAQAGVCVVSGLALGIDTAAHRGALESGNDMSTIAVLGSGLDNIYPRLNEPLVRAILKSGGVVMSQFGPGMVPLKHNFLDRNRVIAGLSDSTLVIQAPSRSDALVTARYALDEGRDVLVVPGAINDLRYEGSNRLIKQGAQVIVNKNDLSDFFPQAKFKLSEQAKCPPYSKSEDAIMTVLRKYGRVHYDQILRLGNSAQVANDLLNLEMGGQINRLPGNYIEATGN